MSRPDITDAEEARMIARRRAIVTLGFCYFETAMTEARRDPNRTRTTPRNREAARAAKQQWRARQKATRAA